MSFAHDAASRVTRVVTARGYGSDFGYDAMGRVTRIEDPLDRVQTRAYNGLGQLTELVDANGNDLVYADDGANRLTGIAPAAGGGGYASFAYDAAGRQTAASNPTGGLSYQYDAAGRLISVGSPQGTVGYQHDGLGRRVAMTQTPTGGSPRTTTYAYDSVTGDLDSITDWTSDTTSFVFTDDGLLSSIDRPNGITTLHNYDAAGRLTGITHQDAGGALAEFGYVLDANGNRVQLDVTGSEVRNATELYAYDALDRLVEADYGTGTAVDQFGRAVRDLPLNGHDLAQAEDYIAAARREIGYVFAPDGLQRARRVGWDTGVSFGGVDLTDATVTHNHPANRAYRRDDPRYDGGGFSRLDLQTAIGGNVAEMRAVTEHYVYVLRRPPGGWRVSTEAVAGADDMRGRPPHDRGIYRDQLDAVRTEFVWRVVTGRLDVAAAESDAEVLHEVVARVARIAGFGYERIERRPSR